MNGFCVNFTNAVFCSANFKYICGFNSREFIEKDFVLEDEYEVLLMAGS